MQARLPGSLLRGNKQNQPDIQEAPANADFADPLPLHSIYLAQLLKSARIYANTEKPVVLCIGTDRIIGDSLGPLTGSLLEKYNGASFFVYGTLSSTVHACNLEKTLRQIKKEHPHSAIIAVDASLGQENKIGSVFIHPGSIKPGMGVSKNLPAAGDISITGIAGARGNQPYLTLQTARLSLIMAMAEEICACIVDACG
ncbi:MAG: spore protease YyaC [Lachnospiraceae bacterium]|nr:spore protease YyaC [Lachnospiraceae bacterium]